jgi:predicted transcriptional regulator
MTKKRTKLEIIRDILEVIKNKSGRIKPTHILYKSNLSHQMMEEYLSDLIKGNLIREEVKEKSKTYFITEKGLKYLSQYEVIANFTNSFGLEN